MHNHPKHSIVQPHQSGLFYKCVCQFYLLLINFVSCIYLVTVTFNASELVLFM